MAQLPDTGPEAAAGSDATDGSAAGSDTAAGTVRAAGRSAVVAAVRRMLDGGPGLLLPRERGGELRAIPASAYDPAGTGRPAPGLVLFTSGSTGAPKGVALSRQALVASARATEDLLSGPGRWHLCLPHNHIAGLQVVLRALLAGAPPTVAAPGRFAAARFATDIADTLAAAGDTPVYTSLVPTQLVRVLDDAEAARTLARTAAVLLGGSAISPRLLERAANAGIPIVRTYGMSETAGGCVYDGVPFPQVDVRILADGRIALAGPVLADGYVRVEDRARVVSPAEGSVVSDGPASSEGLDPTVSAPSVTALPHPVDVPAGLVSADPAEAAAIAGGFHGEGADRVLVTSDLGRWDEGDAGPSAVADGTSFPTLRRLSVLGRADDIIVTGGENVSPHEVESLLLPLAEPLGFAEVLVTSRPHAEWGEQLVVLLVPTGAHGEAASGPAGHLSAAAVDPGVDSRDAERGALAALREGLHERGVRGARVPQEAHIVPTLPLRSIGKPDRAAAAQIARQRTDEH